MQASQSRHLSSPNSWGILTQDKKTHASTDLISYLVCCHTVTQEFEFPWFAGKHVQNCFVGYTSSGHILFLKKTQCKKQVLCHVLCMQLGATGWSAVQNSEARVEKCEIKTCVVNSWSSLSSLEASSCYILNDFSCFTCLTFRIFDATLPCGVSSISAQNGCTMDVIVLYNGIRDVNGSNTNEYCLYHICFHIFVRTQSRIRIILVFVG